MAEAEDLKSSQCGFDPHSGHLISASICSFEPVENIMNQATDKNKRKFLPGLVWFVTVFSTPIDTPPGSSHAEAINTPSLMPRHMHFS